jgi:acyl dehydratase
MAWAVGQSLEQLKKPSLTREQLKAYAAASGDNNPIHLEEAFAKAAGFPSVIVHGMLSMAFQADHLQSNFPPDRYRVKRLKARFRKVTYPGDVLQCEGVVRKVLPDGGLVVSLLTRNQNGEVTSDGEAEVHSQAH